MALLVRVLGLNCLVRSDTMNLMDYLNNGSTFLIPVLWVLGVFLKKTPKIKDWYIVWILLGVSILFSVLSKGLTVEAVANGIIAAGVAVLGHQVVKQTKERK